jgi:FAD binding domain-containing protein
MLNIEIAAMTGRQVVLDADVIEKLRSGRRGGHLLRGDDGYETARKIYNAMIDHRPAIIARCAGVADVIDAVNFARSNGLLVSVRGGGHNVSGNAVCDGGMMIDLSMAPLRPWREFVRRERLSFSLRSSTRRERRHWISPIASTATAEFAPLIASMMKAHRKNLFRNINIPTDFSSSPSAPTSNGWSGWIWARILALMNFSFSILHRSTPLGASLLR